MKNRLIYRFLLTAFASMLFLACTGNKNQTTEEVFFDSATEDIAEEVVISNADFKDSNKQIKTSQEAQQLGSRTLGDKSKVETMIDGFGNKTETRYFSSHPRVMFVILRTSYDGKKQAIVYGQNGDVKIIPELNETALTATGDEVASTANITGTASFGKSQNFLKKRRNESQPTLQPLPSSQFPKPVAPVIQQKAPSEQQSENNSENAEARQSQAEKGMER